MKRIVIFLLCSLLILSGCKQEEITVMTPEEAGLDPELFSGYDYSKFKDEGITLNVANWGEYMSINEPEMIDVNKTFEAISGIKVNYKTYASNETLYSKIRSGGAAYDIVIPSDYMISKMISEGYLQKLNFDNIPNYSKIGNSYKNLEYDPNNEYSIPYLWGMVCIIYNTTMVEGEITGWSSLWDKTYENNILMFNNPRDAFGIALTYLGYSQNTTNETELEQAALLLKDQKEIVQGYVMDEIFDKMEGGSAAIAPYYAGDAVVMMEDNPDLYYCIPEEGTNQFLDAICIPSTAKNKEAAEMYINFLCETEIAFANCDYTGYSTPHSGAYELLDDEIKNDPLRYPSEEYLENNTEVFINLPAETNELTQTLWNQLKIGTSNPWFVPLFLLALIAGTVLVNVLRARKKRLEKF